MFVKMRILLNLLLLLLAVLLHFTLAAENNVSIIILGDWGDWRVPLVQREVAGAMSRWAEEHHPVAVLTTGDNFYPHGVTGSDDNLWNLLWYDMYDLPGLADLPWYVSVGNHDYGTGNGVEWNQVMHSLIEPRWILPHLWHSFLIEDAHFIIFDTEALRKEENNHTVMMEWLEDELRHSDANWKIVVGHRPLYSAGNYGPVSNTLATHLLPLLENYNADMYICGHDHNLQHMGPSPGSNVDYIISGGGGTLLYSRDQNSFDDLVELGLNPQFFYNWGFVGMTISSDSLYFEFVSRTDEVVYTYTRQKV